MEHSNKRILDELRSLQKGIERILSRLFSLQPPSEPSGSPQQYFVDAVQTNSNPQRETNNPDPVIRAVLNLPQTIRVQDQASKEPKKWWKDRSHMVQVAIFTAGFAYALITWRMWRDSGDNFKVDQRAWVGVDAYEANNVRLRNFGKTPAIDVTDNVEIHSTKEDIDIAECVKVTPTLAKRRSK